MNFKDQVTRSGPIISRIKNARRWVHNDEFWEEVFLDCGHKFTRKMPKMKDWQVECWGRHTLAGLACDPNEDIEKAKLGV